MEDRRRKTEDGRPKMEDRRRKIPKSRKFSIFVTFRGCSKNYEITDFWFFGTEDGRQKVEDGRRKTEGGRQKAEDGRWKTEDPEK